MITHVPETWIAWLPVLPLGVVAFAAPVVGVLRLRRSFRTNCPICHREFRGYHRHHRDVRIKGKHYRIVCGRCGGAKE